MSSRIVACYVMAQVSFMAVNAVLLVYWLIDLWKSAEQRQELIDKANQTTIKNSNVMSDDSGMAEPWEIKKCVKDYNNEGIRKSALLCVPFVGPYAEITITILNTVSCVATVVF